MIGASPLDRGNQKKCWFFVKLNRTENEGIPILSDTNGLHITNQAKAEGLDTQFVSVFTSDNGKHLPDKGLSPYREMGIIQFTQSGIESLLKNIDQTKTAGPDELPAKILKETAKEIAGILSVIFQQSYEDGTLPSDWLTARISAIYKKCDNANPSNYRPVLLTCMSCKIMGQSVPSYRLLPRGTYQPITASWGGNTYHGLTTRTAWGLPSTQNCRGNHISTKCRTTPARHLAYSKEHCTRRHRK